MVYGILGMLPGDILGRVFHFLDPIEIRFLYSDPFFREMVIRKLYQHVEIGYDYTNNNITTRFQEIPTKFTRKPMMHYRTLMDFLNCGLKVSSLTIFAPDQIPHIGLNCCDEVNFHQTGMQNIKLDSLKDKKLNRLLVKYLNFDELPSLVVSLVVMNDWTGLNFNFPNLHDLHIPRPSLDLLDSIPHTLKNLKVLFSLPSSDLSFLINLQRLQLLFMDIENIVLPLQLKSLEVRNSTIGSIIDFHSLDLENLDLSLCNAPLEFLESSFPSTIKSLTFFVNATDAPNRQVLDSRVVKVARFCPPPRLETLRIRVLNLYFDLAYFRFPSSLKELQVDNSECFWYDAEKQKLICDPISLNGAIPSNDCNSLKSLIWSGCNPVSNLKNLHIRRLCLEHVPFEVDLAYFPETLIQLELPGCRFQDLDVRYLTKLAVLDLRNCNFTQVTDVKWSSILQKLDLSGNSLTSLSRVDVDCLFVEGNEIAVIGDDFKYLHILELNIDRNLLNVLDLGLLPKSLLFLHANQLRVPVIGRSDSLIQALMDSCVICEWKIPQWEMIVKEVPEIKNGYVKRYANHYDMGQFYDLSMAEKCITIIIKTGEVLVDIDGKEYKMDIDGKDLDGKDLDGKDLDGKE